jgi:BirA family biotin operon repressor/biotin-[acetyl-CoA-carboxylase] ligase
MLRERRRNRCSDVTFALSERAAEAGFRLASYDEIGSTNAEALQRARDGDHGPLWIVARSQTAGRGRRGRDWQTADGNLAASLLTAVHEPLAIAATLGFVAGLAIADALQFCAPGLDVSLKWPNDVVSGGAKLAGILLESEPLNDAVAVIAGIGVNVVSEPQDLPYPAMSLASIGRHVRAEQLFAALSDAWIGYQRIWDGGAGMGRIRLLWLERAAGLGHEVRVQVGEKAVEGTFETLDSAGRLMVRSPDNALIPVAAGEVYFGSAATLRDDRGAR